MYVDIGRIDVSVSIHVSLLRLLDEDNPGNITHPAFSFAASSCGWFIGALWSCEGASGELKASLRVDYAILFCLSLRRPERSRLLTKMSTQVLRPQTNFVGSHRRGRDLPSFFSLRGFRT